MKTTQEQFEILKVAADAGQIGGGFEYFDDPDEMDDEWFETAETLDDFRNAKYREIGSIHEFSVGGYQGLDLKGVQVKKGERRQDVVVIDFGTHRAGSAV